METKFYRILLKIIILGFIIFLLYWYLYGSFNSQKAESAINSILICSTALLGFTGAIIVIKVENQNQILRLLGASVVAGVLVIITCLGWYYNPTSSDSANNNSSTPINPPPTLTSVLAPTSTLLATPIVIP